VQISGGDAAINALANSPELLAVSMRLAKVGSAGAKKRARVDTGEMRRGIIARRIKGGARVLMTTDHDIFNEFGTSRMPAQPMLRPSMDDLRGVL
jgi:HK97 gp10 family phage protein